MSPDGEAIVTGAGDETLRFWNVFSKTRSTKVCFSFLFWGGKILSILAFLQVQIKVLILIFCLLSFRNLSQF